MAKRKTEDQLKETISRQAGEIQRMKRQLTELTDIKNDAADGQDAVQRQLDRVTAEGSQEIELRRLHKAEQLQTEQMHKIRDGLITNIEQGETIRLRKLQAQRRMMHSLGMGSGRLPIATISFPSNPLANMADAG